VSGALACYAVTAPGLERWTAAELLHLGITPSGTEPGGTSFEGSLQDVARANLWLRSASRVLVRLGAFHARALGELERKAGDLPWAEWLPRGTAIRVHVSCRKSRLYHQKAVAERILAASGATGQAGDGDDDAKEPETTQRVIARLFRDECMISLDSSGPLLHRRGYRLATAKAPLRETLAAGLVLASGWQGDLPLLDPFAGSGTILIEAALLARRLPPGLSRGFSFQHWLPWNEPAWQTLIEDARATALPRAPFPLIGSDRDAGAIAAAKGNAERAGVAGDIEWRCAAVSALAPPATVGAMVSNPPYGVRLGASRLLKKLYGALGRVARERLGGWSMTLLLPREPLERGLALSGVELFRSSNGGIPVRAVKFRVPGAEKP
jgi:putative N6-adenine-specific DNA methylase